jgi:putative ABC transport system permease protein
VTLLNRAASIVRWIARRDAAEQQLDEELRAYVDLAAADKIRDGVPPADARRLAILELGGIEQTKERVRTYRHGALLHEIGRDVRYAVRMFAAHKGFTLVVVLTLALGIGANTAIFSLMDALVLRWLPVRDPQHLVQIKLQTAGEQTAGDSFSYPLARVIDEQTDLFAGAAGFSAFPLSVGNAGAVEKISAAVVTGAFYDTLGVNATIGRLLTRDDDRSGAPPAGVISFGLWERQFARSLSALGQTLRVNGAPVTIVGVSPRGFVGANVGMVADLTIPVAAIPLVVPQSAPLLGAGNFWLRVLARPRPGVSAAQAQERLTALWPRVAPPALAPHWPAARRQAFTDAVLYASPGGTGWTVLREMYVKPLRVLMAAVALVLLIACANIASLLLARASARQREIAVRLALGASRGRIVRQLLIESTLLSAIGAAFGVGLAWFSGTFLIRMISTGRFDVAFDLTPNAHILGFTAAVAIATGVFFGVVPALQTTAIGPAPVLTAGARVSGSRSRLLPALVSGQVALSLVLLVGAALFVRTFQNLRHLDLGFRPDAVLLVDLEGRRTAVPVDLLDQVRRVPGVVTASVSTHTPLSGSIWSEPAVPAGQPIPERDNAFFVGAGPGFFTTLQIPLLAGRDFTERDSAAAPAVAIVNERFAERHFGHQNPIGQHLAARVRGEKRDLEIVGVAKNTSAAGLRRVPPATVYVAYAQLTGDLPTTLEMRVAGSTGEVSAAVRQLLRSALSTAAIDVRPLAAQVDATTVQERMMATLATAFGLLALLLACIGLYGLLAYSVVRQTKEIGIRMALGAQRTRVIALIIGRATLLTAIGIALGLPAAWGASRWIASLLFNVTPTDAAAVGSAVALLATAALAAAYRPAWRASRVNPVEALRHD